ncbi:MAG: thiol peroxidase [Bacteroidales bacterium]|nr:thiol peroxidase [Bacteroidales bacterium]
MAKITFKGSAIDTAGELPKIGTKAPEFSLTGSDLSDIELSKYKGKNIVLNIFPSIDTGVCASSVRKFNAELSKLQNTVVICISKDLPFAQGRFCGAEGLSNVITASEYKDNKFSDAYKVKITTGPLAGLHSRAVVVINPEGVVSYTEQVPEIAQEPNYENALKSIK